MEIGFKNFRCFEDTGPIKLKKITLLVGENSTGKTSFLAGLNHVSSLLNGEENDLNSPPFELGSFVDIHYNGKRDNDQLFEYECKVNSNFYHWTFKNYRGEAAIFKFSSNNLEHKILFELGEDSLLISGEGALAEEDLKYIQSLDPELITQENTDKWKMSFTPDKFSNVFVFKPLTSEIFSIAPLFIKHILDTTIYSRRIIEEKGATTEIDMASHLLRHLVSPYEKIKTKAIASLCAKPKRIYSFGQSKRNGNDILTNLTRVEEFEVGQKEKCLEVINHFGENSGLFKKIQIEHVDKNVDYPSFIKVETKHGTMSNIIDVGYGVSQILPIIYEIVASAKRSRFLIQQPEIYLHPRGQAAFASLIAELTKTEKEFVVETHSDFILDRLQYEIANGTISNEDVGILFFEIEEGKAKIHQIDLNENGLPADPPPSYRRFFLEEVEKVWS